MPARLGRFAIAPLKRWWRDRGEPPCAALPLTWFASPVVRLEPNPSRRSERKSGVWAQSRDGDKSNYPVAQKLGRCNCFDQR